MINQIYNITDSRTNEGFPMLIAMPVLPRFHTVNDALNTYWGAECIAVKNEGDNPNDFVVMNTKNGEHVGLIVVG